MTTAPCPARQPRRRGLIGRPRALPLALGVGILLAACTSGPVSGPNPFQDAARAVGIGQTPDERQRRAALELLVKSEFPAILADLDAGGGPVLTRALDTARVPPQDRPGRLLQLRSDAGLYSANPSALVTALMLYGG